MKPLALLAALLIGHATNADMAFRVVGKDDSAIEHAVITADGPDGQGPEPSQAVMDQIDKAFSPYVLAVPEGTDVAFPNRDQIRHHVYSFSEAKTFELKLYKGEPEAPIEFDKSGVVVLGCNIHDNMLGYIYVSDKPYLATSDEQGRALLQSADGLERITVWHPALSLDAQKELKLEVAQLARENGEHVVVLPIGEQPENPQSVEQLEDDRFRRYIDP